MNCQSQKMSLWARIRKPVLSFILAMYLSCALVIYAPPSQFSESFVKLAKPIFGYAGLCYAFRPFTPDPRPYDDIFTAVVELSDGSKRTWTMPNMTQLQPGDLEGHLRCMRVMWHLHFWDCYSYRLSKDQMLWQDTALYAARLFKNDSSPPRSVTLWRDRRPIAVPGSVLVDPELEKAGTASFFEYTVQPGDLK